MSEAKVTSMDSDQKSYSQTSNRPTQYIGKSQNNKHSRGKSGKRTGNSSRQRNNKPQQTKPVRRGPVFSYVSVCCNVPALKPRAAQKSTAVDPETKKSKADVKGLGHWRCPGCRKACKATRHAPKAADTVQEVTIATVTV